MNEQYRYYVKGREFEWTMALATFVSAIMLITLDNAMFGVPLWMLVVVSKRTLSLAILTVGWMRICSLMFNGQILFGRKFGWQLRAVCAVLSAVLWVQFALALIQLSIDKGYISVGIPFWTMFVVTELSIAYSLGAQWKKS